MALVIRQQSALTDENTTVSQFVQNVRQDIYNRLLNQAYAEFAGRLDENDEIPTLDEFEQMIIPEESDDQNALAGKQRFLATVNTMTQRALLNMESKSNSGIRLNAMSVFLSQAWDIEEKGISFRDWFAQTTPMDRGRHISNVEFITRIIPVVMAYKFTTDNGDPVTVEDLCGIAQKSLEYYYKPALVKIADIKDAANPDKVKKQFRRLTVNALFMGANDFVNLMKEGLADLEAAEIDKIREARRKAGEGNGGDDGDDENSDGDDILDGDIAGATPIIIKSIDSDDGRTSEIFVIEVSNKAQAARVKAILEGLGRIERTTLDELFDFGDSVEGDMPLDEDDDNVDWTDEDDE